MKRSLAILLLIVAVANTSESFADTDSVNNTLCKSTEHIYFNCLLENKKTVSICGDTGKDEKGLVYRYGVNSNIELTYPKEVEQKKQASFYRVNASGGSVVMDVIKFKLKPYTYNIFLSYSAGIAVWSPQSGIVMRKACRENFHPEHIDELSDRISLSPTQDNSFE